MREALLSTVAVLPFGCETFPKLLNYGTRTSHERFDVCPDLCSRNVPFTSRLRTRLGRQRPEVLVLRLPRDIKRSSPHVRARSPDPIQVLRYEEAGLPLDSRHPEHCPDKFGFRQVQPGNRIFCDD